MAGAGASSVRMCCWIARASSGICEDTGRRGAAVSVWRLGGRRRSWWCRRVVDERTRSAGFPLRTALLENGGELIGDQAPAAQMLVGQVRSEHRMGDRHQSLVGAARNERHKHLASQGRVRPGRAGPGEPEAGWPGPVRVGAGYVGMLD